MKHLKFSPFAWMLTLVLSFGIALPAFGQAGRIVVDIPGQFGGAVNEDKFRNALEAWMDEGSKVIDQFRGLSPEEADKLFISEDPLGVLEQSSSLEDLNESASPVLERWMLADESELSDGERAVLDTLEKSGVQPESSEGSAFLIVNRAFFSPLLKPFLSQDGADYMAVIDSQPPFLISDAGLVYDVEEVGAFAVQWEKFIDAHAASIYAADAMSRYETLMDLVLFCTLDNTPAFPFYNNEKMSDEWRTALATIAKTQSGTRTAAIAADFLAAVKADGYKLSPKTEAAFRQRIKEASHPE